MATFQKLTDVAVAEVVSEQANVFIEDGGELKRVAKSQVGGAGSLADLKDVVYFHVTLPEMNFGPMSLDNSGVAPADLDPDAGQPADQPVVTCNKTFNEILDLILNHELKMVTGVVWDDNNWNQMQLMVYDWWIDVDEGEKVFDNTATYISFYVSIEDKWNYNHNYSRYVIGISNDGYISMYQPSGGDE